ncbi:MAG: hypothetical protein EA417_15205 [Gammaproteobacteria bacterium]|nr:MAG: hypothetical protein EA417_15205 [Gammaproteobacteria bacterium]
MRGRRPLPAEDDGLQTDVMRFMAIIAFCLVAILALVRQVEPEAASDDSAMSTVSFPPEPEPVTREPRTLPTIPDPVTEPKPEPVPERSRESLSIAANPTAAEPDDTSEEGLVLRFASDSDFLRLVNSGRLEVFAFSDDGAWQLAPGLFLRPASAPGALHELLPSTLPAAMRAALTAERGSMNGYRWGMRMPARMEAQIQDLLRSASSGALIIDRNGDVRHETDG